MYFAEEVYPEPEGNRLRGVRVVDERGRVYSAEEGLWDEEGWRLKGYVVEGRRSGPLRASSPSPPGSAPRRAWAPGTPTTPPPEELWARAQVEPEARFAFHRRLADALGGLVLGAAAAALGLSLREAAWAFLGVVLLIFGYYVLWTLAAQLARYDVSPLLAYLPDLFYGALAGALAWRLR